MKKLRRVIVQAIKVIKQREARRRKIGHNLMAFYSHQLGNSARMDQQLILMTK